MPVDIFRGILVFTVNRFVRVFENFSAGGFGAGIVRVHIFQKIVRLCVP